MRLTPEQMQALATGASVVVHGTHAYLRAPVIGTWADPNAAEDIVRALAAAAVQYQTLRAKVDAVLALRDPDAEYDIADIQEMLS